MLTKLSKTLKIPAFCFKSSMFFSLEKEISSNIENLSENILRGGAVKEPLLNNLKDCLNQPKWMKFFLGNEPMKIDLERSIKNENREMIINYIKINYITFDFSQLVLSLEKKLTHDLNNKLLHEIKLRISMESFQTNPQINYVLLSYSPEYCCGDPLISKFLAVEFIRDFNGYLFNEKIYILNFLIEINMIPKQIIENFLEEVIKWRVQPGLKEFSIKQLNKFIANIGQLEVVIEKEIFKNVFPQVFLDELFKEVR